MIVLEILRHTPLWVFAVFAALVALGVRRLRASDVPVRRLLILPVAMTLFSLFGLWQAFGGSALASIAWTLAFVATATIGWVLPRKADVRLVHYSSSASRRIHVPGSWLPLALMMTIFFLRYVVAVTLAMHPSLRLDSAYVAGIAALYGLSSGSFVARTANTWRSAFGPRATVAAAQATA